MNRKMTRLPRRSAGAVLTAALVTVTVAACSSSASTTGQTRPSTVATTKVPAKEPAKAPAKSASQLAGTWSGSYSGAYAGNFTLHWRRSGELLHGTITISNPAGTLPINGSVSGDKIRFGTVGSTAITYTGTVSGGSMSGTYEVHGASGATGGPWSATKS
jgi:hypothetical protein